MQSLTPLNPVMFQHDGDWKTGTLMKENAVCYNEEGEANQVFRLVKLSCTGEVVMVDDDAIQKNPCREDERREEAAQ